VIISTRKSISALVYLISNIELYGIASNVNFKVHELFLREEYQ